MPEPRIIRPKDALPRDLDPMGRRALQLFRDTVGGNDVGINYGEWEPGASNGPHTRTKDELIFALHGKGEVIVEGGLPHPRYGAVHLHPHSRWHYPHPPQRGQRRLHPGQLCPRRAVYRTLAVGNLINVTDYPNRANCP